MKIEGVVLREIRLPLVNAFETSFGKTLNRRVLLVEVEAGGLTGWGECVAGERPGYGPETADTAWLILSDFLLPRLDGWSFEDPAQCRERFRGVRGHRMAKASVEAALWDLQAQKLGLPLWKLFGGIRERIPCGVSIGIQENQEELLRKVETELAAGYRRIKIKIKPGWDVEAVAGIRRRHPDVPLMVDANGAYTLQDAEHLRELDQYKLLMIEQPLGHEDLLEHASLQSRIKTPLCLDESIRHVGDAELAVELQACRIINIKIGRVGGAGEAVRIHNFCQNRGVPVWCGGMLETGIGRAQNVAISTLANFKIPGDVSASGRYYARDTVIPPIELTSDGHVIPSSDPGLGYKVDRPWIEELTVRKAAFPQ